MCDGGDASCDCDCDCNCDCGGDGCCGGADNTRPSDAVAEQDTDCCICCCLDAADNPGNRCCWEEGSNDSKCGEYAETTENVAFMCFMLNIFFPSSGTFILSLADRDSGCCRCDLCAIAILQLVLAPIILGWIWSILFGFYQYQYSKSPFKKTSK